MPSIGAPRATGVPNEVEAVRPTMRAIVHRRYGPPEVLALERVARPVPAATEVLVRVCAAGANVGDHHVVTGKPYLIRLSPFGGLPRPRHLVPGQTLAGRVEAVGEAVTAFRPGDEVFGQADAGAYAEFVAVAAERLAPKPANLAFDEAAAVPWAFTALQGLRDAGGLVAGQRVLINGASGGVGTWALQLAKALGAEVTAVCSTRNVDLVRALGADHVIDYARVDFTEGGGDFDLMLDLVGNRPLAACLSVLGPEGAYVACSSDGGDWIGPMLRIGAVALRSRFTRQRLRTFIVAPNQSDLLVLKGLVEAGQARPVIERRFALADAGEALRHVGSGHGRGQSVIRIAE